MALCSSEPGCARIVVPGPSWFLRHRSCRAYEKRLTFPRERIKIESPGPNKRPGLFYCHEYCFQHQTVCHASRQTGARSSEAGMAKVRPDNLLRAERAHIRPAANSFRRAAQTLATAMASDAYSPDSGASPLWVPTAIVGPTRFWIALCIKRVAQVKCKLRCAAVAVHIHFYHCPYRRWRQW